MNLHRLNHNTFEPQIFTEESTHNAKHILNLSEFSRHKTGVIKLTNLTHIQQD